MLASSKNNSDNLGAQAVHQQRLSQLLRKLDKVCLKVCGEEKLPEDDDEEEEEKTDEEKDEELKEDHLEAIRTNVAFLQAELAMETMPLVETGDGVATGSAAGAGASNAFLNNDECGDVFSQLSVEDAFCQLEKAAGVVREDAVKTQTSLTEDEDDEDADDDAGPTVKLIRAVKREYDKKIGLPVEMCGVALKNVQKSLATDFGTERRSDAVSSCLDVCLLPCRSVYLLQGLFQCPSVSVSAPMSVC